MRFCTLLPLFLLTACAGSSDKADTGNTADTSGGNPNDGYGDGACVSGSEWTGGNEESPLMNPGEACISCHTAEREGPRFSAAGTVFTNYDEPNDCNGARGATVRITDANGEQYEATTNSAGNFYFEERMAQIAMPFTAEVEFADGTVAAMGGSKDSGDCNSCHTQDGAEGAPGRISNAAAN